VSATRGGGEGEIALAITASKRYGEHLVLDGASLTLRRGTVHALVGENGAGKSTLAKIAFGLVRADGGSLDLGGPIDLAKHSAKLARARGLGLVHQHGSLVPSLTVVENAVLGAEPTRGGLLDLAPAAARLAALAAEVGLDVDPRRRAGELSVGEQQRAEILSVLFQGARTLILDEPTAVLAPVEVDGLLATLRRLVAAGTSVVLVSHKLDEVRAVADAITVLRAGRVVAVLPKGAPAADIARAMMGEATPSPSPSPSPSPAPSPAGGLVLRDLSASQHGGRGIRGITLRVAPGEIVGVAGVEGNGQAELALTIAGLLPASGGSVQVAGRDVTRAAVAARHAAGLGHVPADRHERGLVLSCTVAENLALGRLAELSPGIRVDERRLRAFADTHIAALDVRPADSGAITSSLSGGNQQKLVIARELSRPGLAALIAAQPTRGVDLGAVARIHAQLRAAAAAGVALLVVSADLDELLALCHRIVVLSRGVLAGEVTDLAAAGARTHIGQLMTAADPGAAA
jgi:ABC-type uncharacterized transport system ATPase subunit